MSELKLDKEAVLKLAKERPDYVKNLRILFPDLFPDFFTGAIHPGTIQLLEPTTFNYWKKENKNWFEENGKKYYKKGSILNSNFGKRMLVAIEGKPILLSLSSYQPALHTGFLKHETKNGYYAIDEIMSHHYNYLDHMENYF